ncbi:5282_t:CDS:2 [Ambispora gerdemannii]|uniref:5282_t:CDS:1 n=1 Tax=Ambispora gerdemannii TaxID=144530 RepID=A0A9N8W8H5_9GLOM|nr:5282_t:CDS:2 [Ambispora gerdemannii]
MRNPNCLIRVWWIIVCVFNVALLLLSLIYILAYFTKWRHDNTITQNLFICILALELGPRIVCVLLLWWHYAAKKYFTFWDSIAVFCCKKEAYLIGGEKALTRRQIRTLGNCSDAITFFYLIFMCVALYINFGNFRTSLSEGITNSDIKEQVRNGIDGLGEGIKNPLENSGHADRKILTILIGLVLQAMILSLRVILRLLSECSAAVDANTDERGNSYTWTV